MNLLALDFETQCDNAKTTRITEVGAAWFFDNHNPPYAKRGKISFPCWESDYPPQTEFIVDLTGLSDDYLKTNGITRLDALTRLMPMINEADVIFAHKKAFDQTVFEATCKSLNLAHPKKEWICTLSEFKWPKKFTCLKLGHLAFEHGLFDPTHPNTGQSQTRFDRSLLHRAGDDAELLLVLVTEKYDLKKVLAYAREKWIYFKADILPPWKDGGEQKKLAWQLGFTYESPKHDEAHRWEKTWVKRVKECDLSEAQKSHEGVPFRISIIEGIN